MLKRKTLTVLICLIPMLLFNLSAKADTADDLACQEAFQASPAATEGCHLEKSWYNGKFCRFEAYCKGLTTNMTKNSLALKLPFVKELHNCYGFLSLTCRTPIFN